MTKQYRSYSDHEIANYVLGVRLSESNTTGIQHNLSNNNAAAARALKWEAYFLGIVDGLAPQPPDAQVLNNIQQTLQINLADNATPINQDKDNEAECARYLADKKKNKCLQKFKINKFNMALITAIIIIIALVAIISTQGSGEKTLVQETVNLNK